MLVRIISMVIAGVIIVYRKRLSKYIFYSSFSLLTFAAKKIISYDAAT